MFCCLPYIIWKDISSNADRYSLHSLSILYRSDVWCLTENVMGILETAVCPIIVAMRGAQLKDGERSDDLMLMLGLNKTIHRLAMMCLLV